jgi:hypothetical protein
MDIMELCLTIILAVAVAVRCLIGKFKYSQYAKIASFLRVSAIVATLLSAIFVLGACASASPEQPSDISELSDDSAVKYDENEYPESETDQAETTTERDTLGEIYFVNINNDAGINVRNASTVLDEGNKILYIEAGDRKTRLFYQDETRTVEEIGEAHKWF